MWFHRLTSSLTALSILVDRTKTFEYLLPHQVQVYAPSTRRSAPFTYRLASLDRNVTAPMRSSGRPILPTGMRDVHCFWSSGLSSRIFLVLRDM